MDTQAPKFIQTLDFMAYILANEGKSSPRFAIKATELAKKFMSLSPSEQEAIQTRFDNRDIASKLALVPVKPVQAADVPKVTAV